MYTGENIECDFKGYGQHTLKKLFLGLQSFRSMGKQLKCLGHSIQSNIVPIVTVIPHSDPESRSWISMATKAFKLLIRARQTES